MTGELRPLRREPGPLASLLEAAASRPVDQSADASTRAKLLAKVRAPTAVGRRPVAVVVGALLAGGAAVAVAVWRAPVTAPEPPRIAPVSPLSFESGSQREEDSAGTKLSSGLVRALATRTNPVRLRTPHFGLIESSSARFEVAADQIHSTLTVMDGEVRVLSADLRRELTLRAGEKLSSEDPRLASPSIVRVAPSRVVKPLIPGCALGDRACWERVSQGEGLAAQNALFALALAEKARGRTDAALARAGEYLFRFPQGVFAPDVRLLKLELLPRQGASEELFAATEDYLDRHEEEPAAVSVWLLRGDLLLSRHRYAEARRAYTSAVTQNAAASVRAEALYGAGLSLLLGGQREEAKKNFEAALLAQPDGPRAAEIRERLRP